MLAWIPTLALALTPPSLARSDPEATAPAPRPPAPEAPSSPPEQQIGPPTPPRPTAEGPPGPPAPTWPEVAAWSDSVVLLEVGPAACTGVVVEPAGQIATAWHCVAKAPRPRVRTADGRRLRARVVASAPRDDLALLEVPELGLPARPLRASPVRPGEALLVIGNPLGGEPVPPGPYEGTLGGSLAAGIVSAVGPRLIQTDAALNPGTSGGPAFDADGAVLGLVSRKLPGEGLAFLVHVQRLRALQEEPRGARRLGGAVGLELALNAPLTAAAARSVGPRLELHLRDRLCLGALLAAPLDARTVALAQGRAETPVLDLSLGLRQGLGQGRQAGFVELGGALLGTVETTTRADLEREPLTLSFRHEAQPLSPAAYARLRWTAFGLRLAALPGRGEAVLSAELGWPGTRLTF